MVGMVTRNRVASATACLESYIANCKRWGRPASFFVFDDSPEPEVRNHYRQLLKALRQQHDVPLSYAGLEEKTAFARRLTDRGVPPEVIRFALLDAFGLSETYGANRNSFLLDAMGQLAFSIDDDTRCRVARSPGHRTGATFGSMARAIRFEAFPDHHAAAQAVSMEPCDVLTLHARPPVCYRIVARPGLSCCHCRAPQENFSAAQGHVAQWHGGKPSPDLTNPSGYARINYYEGRRMH